MRGSVKWYLRSTVKTFLMVVGWSMLMWLFLSKPWVLVGENGRESWEIIYYMLIGYVTFVFSVTLTFYKRDIPLAISMGVSRKNAFLGTCIYTGMNFAVVIIVAAAAGLLAGSGEGTAIWIFWGAVCVVWASIFGTVLGMISKLFGRTAAIISGVALYIFLMAGLVFFGFHAAAARETAVNIVKNEGIFAVAAAFTVIVWCGVQVVHYKTLKKITV